MILQLKNISKSYHVPGTSIVRTILDNITLGMESGDTAAILGPSGSGKTTLLNIAGTLDQPDSGEVFINGKNIAELDDKNLARLRNRNIGFVFQQHYLLPQLTMMENVLLPLLPQKNKNQHLSTIEYANELIAFVGLNGKQTQKPGQMSMGECQRAALVRALINKPDILLADEPTGALDKKSAFQLSKLLLKLNAQIKITIIVVTHSMELAGNMNTIYVLDDAKLNPLTNS
jgi:lipoprotein-releasing system ATP-binding protein